METSAITLHPAIAPEDQARAEFYALLARLYAARAGCADARRDRRVGALGRTMAPIRSPAPGTASSSRAARWTPRRRSRNTPTFSSAWAKPSATCTRRTGSSRRPRNDRSSACAPTSPRLGLGAPSGSTLYEDHLAALLRNDAHSHCRGRRTALRRRSATQRAFFERRIAPWVESIAAMQYRKVQIANYYRRVAQLTSLFLAVERDSLAID